MKPIQAEVMLLVAVLVWVWAVVFYVKAHGVKAQAQVMLDEAKEHLAIPDAVDVWAMQRELMQRSDQTLPRTPTLHPGVILYAALNAEELGETFVELSTALAYYPCAGKPGVAALSERLLTLGKRLQGNSREMRELIAKAGDFGSYSLSMKHAQEIFDGTTDLMVTNAGFALACGLPGAAGYAEVQDSNLSKQNPTTGKIEKTPDGKWIKGSCYYAPNLARVLSNHISHQKK